MATGRKFDSVVGGTSGEGMAGGRSFAVFDPRLAVPEFVVVYRRAFD